MAHYEDCVGGLQTKAEIGKDGIWSCTWTRSPKFSTLAATAATCFFCRTLLDGWPQHAEADMPVEMRHVFRQYVSLSPIVGTSTGSAEALDFLKKQLDTCERTHDACRRIVDQEVRYPTRLVELNEHNGARLILTKDTTPTGPYASLSHSWGKEEMFQCTTDTIEQLMTRIPVDKLRRTFKEAFATATYLGIKYIWIDSLCIIQDSAEDWAREARRMMEVYHRARINLAASISTGATTGLFSNRTPDYLISDPFAMKNGVVDDIFQAVKATLYTDGWLELVDRSPLNRRAWVQQERLLSTRVAHFTSTEIIWDCLQSIASESITKDKLLPRHFATQNRLLGHKRDASLSLIQHGADKRKYISYWAQIVQAYTRCGLTKEHDKLIAINGVAEYLRIHMKDEYHCGLWRTFMEIQLCWHSENYEGRRGTTLEGIAPSWSWASFNGSLNTTQPDSIDGYVVTLFAHVDSVITRRNHRQDGLEEWSGSIRLRCFLTPVKLEGDFSKPRLVGGGMTEHCRNVNLDTAEVFSSKGELYVVPIFDIQDPAYVKYNVYNSTVRGLLLELRSVSGNMDGTYFRGWERRVPVHFFRW
ncbi:HET-domain-containing protein [Xylariaceae sp. FL1272]|nr:HET-domain-containing protein [Xylariaceae sp. FL1272]